MGCENGKDGSWVLSLVTAGMQLCELVTRALFQNTPRLLEITYHQMSIPSRIEMLQASLRVRRTFAILRPQKCMRSGQVSVVRYQLYLLCLLASLVQYVRCAVCRDKEGQRGNILKRGPHGVELQLEQMPTRSDEICILAISHVSKPILLNRIWKESRGIDIRVRPSLGVSHRGCFGGNLVPSSRV